MRAALTQLLSVPGWAVLLLVGLIVFAEDALFIGFVLPGETAAVLGGVAAKLGHVPLWAVITTVVVAAISGDSVGYEVGRHFGPRLLRLRPLAKRSERIDGVRSLLARRGGAAVFLGRWTAFLRAVMPALAGLSHMPYRTFVTFNALGGLAWGVTVVVVGYAAGASYATVEKTVGRSSALAVLAVALLGLVSWRIVKHRSEPRRGRAPMTAPLQGDDNPRTEGPSLAGR